MRYIVPCSIVDHFGGCLEPREKSRLYYNTGTGDRPIIVKFRQRSRRQYFALMGRRATTPTAEELARRQHFADVQTRIAYHYAHPQTLQDDRDAFNNQRVYTSFRRFIWHLAESELNN